MDALKALEEYQNAVDDYIDAVFFKPEKEIQHRKHKMFEKKRELEKAIRSKK